MLFQDIPEWSIFTLHEQYHVKVPNYTDSPNTTSSGGYQLVASHQHNAWNTATKRYVNVGGAWEVTLNEYDKSIMLYPDDTWDLAEILKAELNDGWLLISMSDEDIPTTGSFKGGVGIILHFTRTYHSCRFGKIDDVHPNIKREDDE